MIRKYPASVLFVPVLIFTISFLIASGSLLRTNPELARGITIDLTILSPFLYWVLIRKTNIPKITVVPVFIFGVLTAGFLLPESQHGDLNLVIWYVVPVVELVVVSLIIYNVWKAIRLFRNANTKTDIYDSIRETSMKVIGSARVANLLAMELASLYFALFAWKKPLKKGLSYHRDSGAIGLFIALIGLVVIETAVLHLLVTQWSSTMAWILTIVSIYTAIQLTGHVKAMIRRPISIENGFLYLKYGLFGDVKIKTDSIKELIKTQEEWSKEDGSYKLSVLGSMEPHNVKILLEEQVVVKRAYGFTAKANRILFYVDEPDLLIESIKNDDSNN